MEGVVPAAKRRCLQHANGDPEVIVIDSDESMCTEPEVELQQPVNGLNESQPRCSTPVPEDHDDDDVLSSYGINNESVASFLDEVNEEFPIDGDELDQQEILNELEQSFLSFIDEVEAEEEIPSLMECLPNEVLEDVFVWVPLIELFTSCRLVSKRWNQVISREKFLYWKKTYYQVKAHHLPVVARVDSLILKHKLMPIIGSHETIPPNVTLLHLAKMVSDTFKHPDIDLAKMDEVLKKHPQYSCVQQISQLKKTKRKKKSLTARECLVLLVVCSTSVHQVLHLVFLLNTPQRGGLSPPILTHTQLTEIMFCLATFLYSLWIKKLLPPRFHYYVYYAMNVLERSSPSALLPFSSHDISAAVSVRQPLSPPVPLTSEQMMIVNHPYQQGETVKVVAFAGTGKTATLVELARRHPEKKFLYCVYNKSVQQYAEQQVFGKHSNVSCRTFHSLAYKTFYRSKLISQGLRPYMIFKCLRTPPRLRLHNFAETVLCTLTTFIASDDTQICEKHVSEETFDTQVINHSIPKRTVVQEAKQIWDRMNNFRDKEAKISHDAYLKMFQLSNETIVDEKRSRGRYDYDMILVDEAQDLTPAIVSILRRQPYAMIYVGDPHQSIYRFRGAVNAIASIHAHHTYSLTRSFRFGPEIAYVGSLLLSVMKKVKSRTLVGGLQAGTINGDRDGQVAIIARTNLTLFDEMTKVIESTDLCSKRLGFPGGVESYDFNVLLEILKLKKGEPPSNLTSFIKFYNSYCKLKQYAEKAAWHDPSTLMKINICEKYGDRLPGLIEKIKKQSCKNLADADIVFTTAHKSKGLEFDTVVVAEDFLSRLDPTSSSFLFDLYNTVEDERHLLYVAATRAKRHLVMSTMQHQLLQEAKEPFIFPTGSGDESQQGHVKCACCDMLHRLPKLRLVIRKFTLSNKTVQAGGMVCKFCGINRFPALLFATQDD